MCVRVRVCVYVCLSSSPTSSVQTGEPIMRGCYSEPILNHPERGIGEAREPKKGACALPGPPCTSLARCHHYESDTRYTLPCFVCHIVEGDTTVFFLPYHLFTIYDMVFIWGKKLVEVNWNIVILDWNCCEQYIISESLFGTLRMCNLY